MTTKRFVSLLIWFLCLIVALEFGFGALTLDDTIANLFGIVLLAFFAFLSYRTKCFTLIDFDEK